MPLDAMKRTHWGNFIATQCPQAALCRRSEGSLRCVACCIAAHVASGAVLLCGCVALVSFQGALPTYGKGGSLTRLGGTFVVSRSEEGGAQIVYSFVDKETGVHAPTEEVVEAIHRAAAGKAA